MNPWIMAGLQLLMFVLIFCCGAAAMYFHLTREKKPSPRPLNFVDYSKATAQKLDVYIEEDYEGEELCPGNEEGTRPHPDCLILSLDHGPHTVGKVVRR